MKIVLVDTTNHSREVGGGHIILPQIGHGLVARGHDVHLVTGGTPNRIIADHLKTSHIRVDQQPWGADGLVEDVTPIFASWINRISPNVYLISGSYDLGWTVLPTLKPSIATLMIAHNDSATFYTPVRHYSDFLTRSIGVSEEICEAYENDCGMPRERVDWIPYGVETRDAEPEEFTGPLRLIYVGRFEEEQKRISDVVGVIKRLSAEGVDYRFTLVGDGERMPMVRSALEVEIANGRVRLMGWQASEDVIREMNASDVFVLASAYEGFCISLIEAMANGCTPVVTDIRSGNKQLVRGGENGFVLPIGDIEAFVDRIKVLAGDRQRLMSMRRKAWETGREYSIDRMVENYERCFERAMEDAKAEPRQPDPSFPLMPSCRSKYPLWLRRIKARATGLAR